MIQKMIETSTKFEKKITWLKGISPYWPRVVKVGDIVDNKVFLSTLVRIKRKETWYTVHCVESYVISDPIADFDFIYQRLITSVHNIQNLYQLSGIPGLEDVDTCQISEVDRLKELQNNKLLS